MKAIYSAVITAYCICMLFLAGCNAQASSKKTIHIIFRVDDYSTTSPAEIESNVIDIFRSYNVPVTIGVIPFVYAENREIHNIPLPKEKGEVLKKGVADGIVEVVQHGYSHQEINEGSEFAGLDYALQEQRLVKGKQYLEEMIGVPVTAFVPPWNTYDMNTLMALEDNGFKTISGAMSGPAIRPTSLKFVPFTTRLPGLRDAVDAARQSAYQQPVIVVLFHLYDFKEGSVERGVTTLDEFSDLMNWLTSQEDVRVLSMSQALDEIPDLSASRFIVSKNGSPLYRFAEKAMSNSEKEQYKALYPERAVPLQWTMNAVGYYLAKFIPR